MDRFWLKNYPPGVPADIDPSVYPSLVSLLEESFAKYRDAQGLCLHGQGASPSATSTTSRKALAAWLQSRGLEKGARVAIMMPNVLQYPIAVAAVLRAGFIAVNVNPLYTARELEHQLQGFRRRGGRSCWRTSPRRCSRRSRGTRGEARGRRRRWATCWASPRALIVNFVVRTVKKMVPRLVAAGRTSLQCGDRRRPVAWPSRGPSSRREDIAVLQYTGGTTGVAKGAMLLAPHHRRQPAGSRRPGCSPACMRKPISGRSSSSARCRSITSSPSSPAACSACARARMNVLIPNPRDIPGTIKELAKYRLNIFPAVNTLFNALANNAEFAKLDFSAAADLQRRRHGGAGGGREEVARRHRLPDRRRLWPERDLAGGHLQPDRFRGLHRHDRPADAQRLDQDPRRRRQGAAARRGGRDRDQGPAGDERLLAAARRDRQGHDARRLLQVGRHRHAWTSAATSRSSIARRT